MAKGKKVSLADAWHGSDPREVPAYAPSEAAQYLCIPVTTIRSWITGHRDFKRVIDPPKPDKLLLSFFNLVEAHVLRSMRTFHGIDLPRIQRALDAVKVTCDCERPLINMRFMTDGISHFVEQLAGIDDAPAPRQLVIEEVMRHLERIEWENEVAARLYPFTRCNGCNSPRTVFLDPRYSFGRPILKDSHIATAIVAERYKAGDSIDDLAEDYGCSRLEIEEGVRCELRLEAAA